MGMTIDQELAEISDLALKIKTNYLAKLKADRAAMLTEIRDKIASNYLIDADTGKIISGELRNFEAQILLDNLKNEIDKLKENINK